MQGLYTYYYFLGIGGIGMSALARYFNLKGARVYGYDRTSTVLTKKLESEGISISYTDSIEEIPDEILHDKNNCLIIYTPAIPDTHKGYSLFVNNGFNIVKRAKVLGSICNPHKGIGIAGTHGKTSVTTFTTHLMYNSEVGCSAFLGGISKNFKSNFVFSESSDFVIIEADEYDRSFHKLYPQTALITSMDADHLDIYGKHESILDSFYEYANHVSENGNFIYKYGLPVSPVFTSLKEKQVNIYSYSLNNSEADFYASSIIFENGKYTITLETPFGQIQNLNTKILGSINIENIIAATSIALCNGVTADEIRESLQTLQGVERRLDLKVSNDKYIYIDDYAHHPEEIKAFISSVKGMFPNKKITGVFQPHLYSRTKDFASEFAESLSQLNEVILLDIYPARELPIEGVSSEIIAKKINTENQICSKEDLINILKDKEIEVLITMGAGNIDTLVNPICQMLEEK